MDAVAHPADKAGTPAPARLLGLAALLACLALWAGQGRAGETATPDAVLGEMLTALAADDRAGFVARGDAAFAAAVDTKVFAAVRAHFGERLRQGCAPVFLGRLAQQGVETHLWKLSFADRGDDALARLALRGGKVAGFWLQ